ncbi:hypothetical protein CC86DRAFT_447004 [Ophiobolus disseminans]|uniref:Uncharacterized protein n=1 Tax=Ophiobolus disseminans TaxID=1469910 RepID=A0A6A6ZWN6_9PLEO|nr:hypothetical protein CC86DRAFT_447004 [Ophiobolus disseminans]
MIDCIAKTPTSLNLTAINICQSEATTPFCWPPNGTRICARANDIRFYWPPTYYHSDSRVAIEYDLTSSLTLFQPNTGNSTEYFTSYMFDRKALPIPDTRTEKSMKMYMRERRYGSDVLDKTNLAVHEGPTIILVKTADFTSSTRSLTRATATSRPYSGSSRSSDYDDKPHFSSGALAGVIIGSIIGFVAVMVCCCRGCCGKKRRAAKPELSAEEQMRIAAQGLELMEQRKAVGVREAEEGRGGGGVVHEEGPPPKYTP